MRLEPGQAATVSAHHDAALAELARRFDVDTTARQRQLSLGMASRPLLGRTGALRLDLAFVRRFWVISDWLQIVLLASAPIAPSSARAGPRRASALYHGAVRPVGFGAFVLNLHVLAGLLNLRPSLGAFLTWAAFAMLLAYAWGLTWLLIAAIVAAVGFLTGFMPLVAGIDPSARWRCPRSSCSRDSPSSPSLSSLVTRPRWLRRDVPAGGSRDHPRRRFMLSDWGATGCR